MIELSTDEYAQVYKAIEDVGNERDEARQLAKTLYEALKDMYSDVTDVLPELKIPSWINE